LSLALLVMMSAPGSMRGVGRYGDVAFSNSGAASAQSDFLEGLALLHNFEYPSAAAAFQRAEAADAGFAMAYWGEAMTFNHPVWMQQNLAAARAALGKLGASATERRAKAKSDREKEYIDAVEILYGEGSKLERDLRYERAMAKLREHYPDDVDASAFYGLAILGTAHAGRDTAIYMRAAAVLEENWLAHREHPGLVHYLIHCYDDPTHAPLGLRAARIYARVAPDAPHAQHMTSHIFLALGMWPETVEANVAAVANINRRRHAEGKGPIYWGHYSTWLAYAYLQLGQSEQVRNMLTECHSEIESQAASDVPSDELDPDRSGTASLANMRLRFLVDTGDWQSEAAQWIAPTNTGPGGRLDFALADAFREIALRRKPEAQRAVESLKTISREVIEVATRQASPDPTDRVRPEIVLLESRGLLAELEGDVADAEKLLRQAVGLEETIPIAFGPPTVDKPTYELLGQFLLRQGHPGEAHAQFEKALARTPGRRVARKGLEVSAIGLPPLAVSSDTNNETVVLSARENDPICGLPMRR
jgi:tetratricopeptide (TPR) repeat protein